MSEEETKLSPNECPDEFLATDRILLRWARSIGDGSKDPSWYEYVRSQCDALSDDVAIIVDLRVLRSGNHREITELWYRTPQPREAIARSMHVRYADVYVRWNTALQHFRHCFENGLNREDQINFARHFASKFDMFAAADELRRLAAQDVRQHARYVRDELMRAS